MPISPSAQRTGLLGRPLPIRKGVKSWSDDADYGGREWWLFPLMSDEDAKDWCEEMGIHAHRGGPGCEFSRRPCFRHSLSFTLIYQDFGLDV